MMGINGKMSLVEYLAIIVTQNKENDKRRQKNNNEKIVEM